jgi:hypothetical protein
MISCLLSPLVMWTLLPSFLFKAVMADLQRDDKEVDFVQWVRIVLRPNAMLE